MDPNYTAQNGHRTFQNLLNQATDPWAYLPIANLLPEIIGGTPPPMEGFL